MTRRCGGRAAGAPVRPDTSPQPARAATRTSVMALPRRQLALGVLRVNPALATPGPGLGATPFEIFQDVSHALPANLNGAKVVSPVRTTALSSETPGSSRGHGLSWAIG